MIDINGPQAVRDDRSAPFYDAAARGELLIRRCSACGHALAPEARTCSGCGGQELGWASASGAATLVSWAVVTSPPLPDFGDQVPFPVGLVELAEGPWLHARIVPGPGVSLHQGMPLRVAFAQPAEGEAYPVFVAG